jgi:FAD/FMN-containing dehydrogenase
VEEARQAWNLAVDQRPAAVAFPESAGDVVAVVELARSFGLRVAPRGQATTRRRSAPRGHGPREDGEVAQVSIDPEQRTARVEAGVLARGSRGGSGHGLAVLSGSSPDVGVVGYTLGGGVSFLGRKHGLASNSVTAVELVTADGMHCRVTTEIEPDLFWALRGGGGDFGIVTALEFRLFLMESVYAGILWWPIERASEVLQDWGEIARAGLPDETTTVGRLLQLPPLLEIPGAGARQVLRDRPGDSCG